MTQKNVITKLLQSATKIYQKMCQVLQCVTDCYYKMRQVLQSATFVTKWTKHFAQSTNYWWVIRPSATGWNQFLCESYIAIIDKYVSKLKCSNPRKWA